MNGVHDMGGMHGFGRVAREEHEPVFHEPWEGREHGMRFILTATQLFPLNEFRYEVERLDPVVYLNSSYYARHLEALIAGLIDKGVITPEELAERSAHYAAMPHASIANTTNPAIMAVAEARLHARFSPPRELPGVTQRFAPGDQIRARVMHPRGHTRLPRYLRGKRGIVRRCYGFFEFPDHELGDPTGPLQPLYSVEFEMQEVWGESAEPGEALSADLWESYLEPVQPDDV